MIEKTMKHEDKIIPAGTKFVFKAHAGQAGTDTCEFYILTEDTPESVLQDEANQFAYDHAEMYGIYPAHQYSEEDIAEDEESYSENIEGWYEIYDPEEHDGHRIGDDTSWNEL